MSGGTETMLSMVTDGVNTVIGWVGSVVSAVVTSGGALAELGPLFAVGVSISVVFLGVKVIRGIIWGA